MKKAVQIAALIIFVCAFKAFAQDAKEAKTEAKCADAMCEVLQAEAEYKEAFIAPTLETVEKLHTDDFFTTSGNPAFVTTKTDIVNYMKNSGTRVGAVITVNVLDQKVRLYGQTAVVTGIWKTSARSANNNPVEKAERFTRVWTKENGRWRLASSHYSTAFVPPVQP